VWATVDGVRATASEEGVLGLALAPDFATSRLVYVYLTTTDELVNQHVRAYRENANGTGDFLGEVARGLEPPTESSARNGGGLAFGADGCLYVGVGDSGSGQRWNAQLLLGTDPVSGTETTTFCTSVCLGGASWPDRPGRNGFPNDAGKILRLAVEGASIAQPVPGAPFAAQPFAFAAGARNPTGFAVHPLTGQLYSAERGDGLQSEVDVVDAGSDFGWPCLEGDAVAASAACLVGHPASDVYAVHPDWRRPIATHAGSPALTGLSAYTGLAYPAEYYGDVFYLFRDSDRIYRLDLAPPCFLPHPNGVAPTAFHDSTDDDDFSAVYDVDADGEVDIVRFPVLTAIAEAPDPLGRRVLYVAGRQGTSSAFTEDSAVFRIEYTSDAPPYAGPTGRVAEACFTDGVYSGGDGSAPLHGWDNPFRRPACFPPGGPCPGAPDGTPCGDGDPCSGSETCRAGICQHGSAAPDGTACGASDGCRAPSVCQAGACTPGPALADGTACSDGDPCDGREACVGGRCERAGPPGTLLLGALTAGGGGLALHGSFRPAEPLAPATQDDLALELAGPAGMLAESRLAHPASDAHWRRRGGVAQYRNPRNAGLTAVVLRRKRSGEVRLDAVGRRMALAGGAAPVEARVVVGEQCFVADLTGRCTRKGGKLRCRR
jgi:glucose/arabinose dehydrogenase